VVKNKISAPAKKLPTNPDKKYLDFVSQGDLVSARKVLDAVAVSCGFDKTPLYHGTTHTFSEFNKERANIENDFGAGFYFSSSASDVQENYAGLGPDLENRVERLKEEKMNELLSACANESTRPSGPPAWGSDEYKKMEEIARGEALSKLHGGNNQILTVYLGLQNPAVIGGDSQTFLTMETHYDGESDYDDLPPSGMLVEFCDALMKVSKDFDSVDDMEAVVADLYQQADYDSISLDAACNFLKSHEGVCYATDDYGNLASNEILRSALEEMGYDGIIDNRVYEKFGFGRKVGKPMNEIEPGTFHVIAFHPETIKLSNTVVYDENNVVIPPSLRFTRTADLRGGKVEIKGECMKDIENGGMEIDLAGSSNLNIKSERKVLSQREV
jgi:hypothetical protein